MLMVFWWLWVEKPFTMLRCPTQGGDVTVDDEMFCGSRVYLFDIEFGDYLELESTQCVFACHLPLDSRSVPSFVLQRFCTF